MKRLLVICEGQTEAEFVKDCLAPHLLDFGLITFYSPLKTRAGKVGGGHVSLARIGRHIRNEFHNHDYITTLVDYYGFHDNWGLTKAALETGILEQAKNELGEDIDARRLLPYVQLHEFEALLFSDVAKFKLHPDWDPQKLKNLQGIRRIFATPEDIDDSPQTAPSKRLSAVFPGYDRRKTLYGPLIAQDIGLETMRSECPLFAEWLARLEGFGAI